MSKSKAFEIKKSLEQMKIRFVAKLGVTGKYKKGGKEKLHVLVPKEYVDQLKSLKGKQVRVVIDNEF
jgi:hypothetical protein